MTKAFLLDFYKKFPSEIKYYNVVCPKCHHLMDIRQYPSHEKEICLKRNGRPPWMFPIPEHKETHEDYEK